jgi:hypothetical protein
MRGGGDVVQVIPEEPDDVLCVARKTFRDHGGQMRPKGSQFMTTETRADKYSAALVASRVTPAKRETKIEAPSETKPEAPAEQKDYGSMSRDELDAEAEALGLKVKGTGKGGNVLKRDLLKALKG